jgi:hypothetical protein
MQKQPSASIKPVNHPSKYFTLIDLPPSFVYLGCLLYLFLRSSIKPLGIPPSFSIYFFKNNY